MPAPEKSQFCFSDCLQMKGTTGKVISTTTIDIEEKKVSHFFLSQTCLSNPRFFSFGDPIIEITLYRK